MNSVPQGSAARLKGIAFVCAGMLCLVVMDSVNKALSQDLPPYEIAWARNVALMAVLLAVAGPRLGRRLFQTRKPRLQLMRGLCFAAASTFGVMSLQRMPLSDALTILNLQPLMVIALSAPIVGEKVSARQWAAVVAAFVGVLVIMQPGSASVGNTVGGLFMIAASFCGSMYILGNRRLGSAEHPVASLFLCTLVAALALSVLVPFVWVTPSTAFHWIGCFASGLFSGLGHYCLIRAYVSAPAGTLAPFNYSHLLWTLLMSWVILGEPVTLTTFIGVAIIAGAGLYVIWLEQRARGQAAAAAT
jgi:drug/metabolite transporter (DMT)-like permease